MVAGALRAFPHLTLEVGPFKAHLIVAQRFAMDGGAIFGLIPRAIWEPMVGAPDAAHRLPLGAVVAVIEAGPRRILLDAGLGWHLDAKFARIHDFEPLAPDWPSLLAPLDISPGSITDVFLTHLHFDHCGGIATGDAARPLWFPQARHHVQQQQWDWARTGCPRDRASYLATNLAALEAVDPALRQTHSGPESAAAALRDGLPGEVARLLEVRTFHGHTPGLQTLLLRGAVRGPGAPHANGLFFGVDLFAGRQFLRPVWIHAFDHHPLTTMAEKEAMLSELVRDRIMVVFGHEGGRWPESPWAVVGHAAQGPKGFEPGESMLVDGMDLPADRHG